jgi:N-acetyl-gamma-glutamyl-phosphate/LysW-gamma-L-alpha-aminoadipyl-6-phosphate reductase
MAMKKDFGVAIVGGSGYGAGELLRLFSGHPSIEVAAVVSRSHAGKPVSSVHSHLERISSLTFTEGLSQDWFRPYKRAAIVCSIPTGTAVPTINELLGQEQSSHIPIVDLSGDLRLTDPAIHSKHYPEVPFSAQVRSQAVYGLPELGTGQIGKARLITNPGCLATAAILALAPLRDTDMAIHVAVDGKTGTSGAGREPQPAMHHPSRAHDCTAYKVLEHRHEPEIVQALGPKFSARDSFMFVPHLLPVSRGCLVSCYIACRDAASAASLPERYGSFYSAAPFVRLRDRPSRLVDVVGTNFCDLHIVVRGAQVAISSALDNLGKGMAGQCIQNLNLLFGLPEETGLMISSLGPV